MQIVDGLPSALEIARAVARRDVLHDDRARLVFDVEARTPLLHREDLRAVRSLLDAPIGMRLRTERERGSDARAEVDACLARDPFELRARHGCEVDVPRG